MNNNEKQSIKFFIRTFGCQMNVHDSEQMAELMQHAGYVATDNDKDADVIIINTCSVREKPVHKVVSELGRYRLQKAKNNSLVIAIVGCVAQQYGGKMLEQNSCLDIVIGTHNIHKLPEFVDAARAKRNRFSETQFHSHTASLGIQTVPPAGAISAFVTIMQGCNNYCSYCIVPFVRGTERSRSSQEIIAEIEKLADSGIREVALLGQNVNSYGQWIDGNENFANLLRKISKISGIQRIRFTTSHPKDLSEELMRSFAEIEQLCRHIHLPFQSGSNRILTLMNRGYTSDEYHQKIVLLKSFCPDIALSADVIVGFPSESDNDFQDTIALMEEIKFDNLFSFKYSVRAGTAAEVFADEPPETLKAQRLAILQKLQEAHSLEKNKERVGRIEEVLVEGKSKIGGGELTGRTSGNKIVNFIGVPELVGQVVPILITGARKHSLKGKQE